MSAQVNVDVANRRHYYTSPGIGLLELSYRYRIGRYFTSNLSYRIGLCRIVLSLLRI